MRTNSRYCTTIAALACGWIVLLSSSAAAQSSSEDKALGQPSSASSVERADRGGNCPRSKNGCGPGNATDGDPRTRWGSDWVEGQWWQVDLGRPRAVDSVRLGWELSFPERYRMSTSLDGVSFVDVTVVQPTFAPDPRRSLSQYTEATAFAARLARFVRVTSVERFWAQWGISLWEARVTGPADSALTPPPGAPAVPPPAPPPGSQGSKPVNSTPGGPTTAPAPAPASTAPSLPAPVARRLLRPFPVVRIRGTATGGGAAIRLLHVRAPRTSQVRVVCRGRSCRRRIVRQRGSGRVRAMQRFFRAGTVIEVFVTRRHRIGKYTRFLIRKGTAPPLRTDGCAAHRATQPTACP